MNEVPQWILESLCYYDSRNPDNILQYSDHTEEYYTVFKNNCTCDNCFYGRTKLANYIVDNCNNSKYYEKT